MSTMYKDVDMENPDGISGDGSNVCEGLIGNNDWYAVCTVAGIEGFCMKKFIAVRE